VCYSLDGLAQGVVGDHVQVQSKAGYVAARPCTANSVLIGAANTSAHYATAMKLTTTVDTATLAELEHIVDEGADTFIKVGTALQEITRRKLYKEAGYSSFSDYCRERFGFSRQRGYQLISAVQRFEQGQAAKSEWSSRINAQRINEAERRTEDHTMRPPTPPPPTIDATKVWMRDAQDVLASLTRLQQSLPESNRVVSITEQIEGAAKGLRRMACRRRQSTG
jgi:hypothetical protein